MKIVRGPFMRGGSFRRQIILTFVVGFCILISAFSAYLVHTESIERYQDSRDNTGSLAQALAASSRSSVLANDVAGLQEIVQSFQDYPGLRYAMVISPSGRVLAHTDATKDGLFLADEQSILLIKGPQARQVMRDDEEAIDIAIPIAIDGHHEGWARIGVGREAITTELHNMALRDTIFVVGATVLSYFASVLLARRLVNRIGMLVGVAEQVQAGNYAVRAPVEERGDEVASLATSFNRMLDELARNERELRAASLYTRSLIEASLDPLVTISPEGKITDVNAATEKATGKSRAELIGTDFSDYFTEPERARQGYKQVFERGFVTDYPLAIRHRDGYVADVLYNASVYRNEGGEVAGVFAAARDVTERKRAEEKLRQSEASLAEAQRMAHLGNWTLDLVNDVLTWSDEIYRIFEIDPAKFGATYEAFVEAIYPDDREMVNRAYADSLTNRTPYDIVHRLRMADGRIKYVNEKCVTYYRADGHPLRSIGTVHDITQRKLAEDEIRELNRDLERRVAARTAELAEANKELEAFAYSVSHDLRVPLRAIDGFSRIVLEEYEDKLDAEGQRLLHIVREATQKMAQLIDDILAFSRTGRVEMSLAEVDMAEMARQAFEDLKPAVSGRDLQLEIGQLPAARADRAMMARVFTNLLANAVKFTRPKPHALVEVGAIPGDKETTYYVRDNGAGFDMAYVGKLFGVFQRLHGTDEFEGTGIGLAIVKRIVTRHGGRVWAEGKPNEGATFFFSLPKGEQP